MLLLVNADDGRHEAGCALAVKRDAETGSERCGFHCLRDGLDAQIVSRQ